MGLQKKRRCRNSFGVVEAGISAGCLTAEAGCRIKFTVVRRPVENPALDQDFVKR
jgi:hypothetical protein